MMCLCEYVTMRLVWKVCPAPVGEKCEMTFSLHTRLSPVTYSIFVVFCWSVVKGVGCCLSVRAFQCKIYCRWCTVLI